MANISINDLSLTISELVELDAEQQSLLDSALDRAISAKDVVGGQVLSRATCGIIKEPILIGIITRPDPIRDNLC